MNKKNDNSEQQATDGDDKKNDPLLKISQQQQNSLKQQKANNQANKEIDPLMKNSLQQQNYQRQQQANNGDIKEIDPLKIAFQQQNSQRQSFASIYSEQGFMNQNPPFGPFTCFSNNSLRASFNQPQDLARLQVQRDNSNSFFPQTTSNRDSFLDYLPQYYNSAQQNNQINQFQVYSASDIKQVERILVDTDYQLKDIFIVQITYPQQIPFSLITYVYQKYYLPGN